MSTTTISYWMPLAKVRLTASTSTAADSVLGTARPRQLRLEAAERDLDLARQRLLQAGQAATAADFAEVERLKQEKEIAELRTALAAATGAG